MSLGHFLPALAAFLMLVAAPRAQPVPDPVKIGILGDFGSPADARGGGPVVAARMAVADFGSAAAGHPVVILAGDHLGRVELATAIARQWFDQDGIAAIVVVASPAVAQALESLAGERGRILIASGPVSPDFTGRSCSPTAIAWTGDAYAAAAAAARALAGADSRDWLLVRGDTALDAAVADAAGSAVTAAGARLLDPALPALSGADPATRLRSPAATVAGLALSGTELDRSVEAWSRSGDPDHARRLVGLIARRVDIERIGLAAARGMVVPAAFYWDAGPAERSWSARFAALAKRPPGVAEAGVYSAVLHYLQAVAVARREDAAAVLAEMRDLPVEDAITSGGHVRPDGSVQRDIGVFAVKAPEQSAAPHDVYRMIATVPGRDAFRPLADSPCPLLPKR